MELTLQERLMLSNQFKILAILYPDDADHYQLNQKIVEQGYKLHYKDLVEWFNDEMPEGESRAVVDILNMYRAITGSYKSLKDKAGLPDTYLEFPGFDGNSEAEYLTYAQFFMEDMDRFEELQTGRNQGFNSHMPMMDKYYRMLVVWHNYGEGHQLSKEQLVAILEA